MVVFGHLTDAGTAGPGSPRQGEAQLAQREREHHAVTGDGRLYHLRRCNLSQSVRECDVGAFEVQP
jgi:hypothetical protein